MAHLQQKATGFLDHGMRFIKDTMREAGRLINATAEATKHHVEKEAEVIGTHRDYHRLGVEVYKLLKDQPSVSQLKVNGSIKEIVVRISKAEKEIAKHDTLLNRMTVVGKPSKKKAAPVRPVPRKASRKPRSPRSSTK